MNKSELIEAIAQEAGISKSAAQKALDATTNAVTNALKSGDTVTLVGFGTFYVGERAERQGRKTQMLFHAFTQYDFIWIIMAES